MCMFVDNKSPGKASQSLTLIYDHVQIFKSSQKDKGSIQNTYIGNRIKITELSFFALLQYLQSISP